MGIRSSPNKRSQEGRTFVKASSVGEWRNTISLAQFVRLNEEEFGKWGERDILEIKGKKHCGAWVPNTAYVHKGNVDGKIGSKGGLTFVNMWTTKRLDVITEHYKQIGYHVKRDNSVTVNKIRSSLQDNNIIAWAFGGHGHKDHGWIQDVEGAYMSAAEALLVHQRLAHVVIYSCYAGIDSWYKIISKYGTINITEDNLWIAFTDWDELPARGREEW